MPCVCWQWRTWAVASNLTVMVASSLAETSRTPTEFRWSIVIPAYNEAERLPRYLREVVGYFDGRDEPYEVLVVDDGSVDNTAVGVRQLKDSHPCVALVR